MANNETEVTSQFDELINEISLLRKEVAQLGAKVRDIRSLVGPFGVTMPDGTTLVQTLFGTKYFIDPTDMIIAPNLIIYRQWEADLSALMAGAVNPDTVFVDVGANFGYFTCLLGSRIGNKGKGRVIAVEPNPKMIELLKRNISVNWSMAPISVQECAASDQEGTAQFCVPAGKASNASLVTGAVEVPQSGSNTMTVPTRMLDSIIPDGQAVDLMKIDVEGHEYAALRGAARIISQSPNIKIIMEWSQPQMKTAGYDVTALIELLEAYQLSAHKVPEDRRLNQIGDQMLSFSELAAIQYDNLILIRKLI